MFRCCLIATPKPFLNNKKNITMNINDAKTYQSIILLNEIITNGRIFRTILNGDDKMLETLFIQLLSKGYVNVEGDVFHVTQAGQNVFDTFMKRYKEYLKLYDIFAFVDTEAGEFAFEKFFDFDTDEQWDQFKNNERFFDVRIAVANFKHMNPHELVFMSFINSGRFDTNQTGWQFDLITDRLWAEIDDICREAISIEDLGEDVIKNIINRGTEVMIDITRQELERKKQELEQSKTEQLCLAHDDEGAEQLEEYIVETTVIVEEYEEDLIYYEPYYDPFFVSTIWLAPLFIW